MVSSDKPQQFSATLYKVGINRCVDVPENVGNAFRRRRYVPVVATVKGHSIRTTLVPRSGGRYRLFLNDQIRKAAGVDAGDEVSIVLRIDRESREIPVPRDLAKALSRTKGGRAAFDMLTPLQKRAFLQYILKAKKPETRERRIREGIELLLEKAARKSKRGRAS